MRNRRNCLRVHGGMKYWPELPESSMNCSDWAPSARTVSCLWWYTTRRFSFCWLLSSRWRRALLERLSSSWCWLHLKQRLLSWRSLVNQWQNRSLCLPMHVFCPFLSAISLSGFLVQQYLSLWSIVAASCHALLNLVCHDRQFALWKHWLFQEVHHHASWHPWTHTSGVVFSLFEDLSKHAQCRNRRAARAGCFIADVIQCSVQLL